MMNKRIDPWLLALTGILMVLGLIMIYSASAVIAEEWSGDAMRYVKRQLIAIGVGGALCAATAVTPTRIMRRYRLVFYLACLTGLVLTFVPGIQHSAKGASRWIGFGSVNLQPSEFAKPFSSCSPTSSTDGGATSATGGCCSPRLSFRFPCSVPSSCSPT